MKKNKRKEGRKEKGKGKERRGEERKEKVWLDEATVPSTHS